jgi:hypothetical protein
VKLICSSKNSKEEEESNEEHSSSSVRVNEHFVVHCIGLDSFVCYFFLSHGEDDLCECCNLVVGLFKEKEREELKIKD